VFHPLKVRMGTYKKIWVPYFYLYYNILKARFDLRGTLPSCSLSVSPFSPVTILCTRSVHVPITPVSFSSTAVCVSLTFALKFLSVLLRTLSELIFSRSQHSLLSL
jgi:hypothetical protein